MKIKKILFISLVIGFSFYQYNALQAQCKGWFWTSHIGGDSSDEVACILYDSISSSSYIAGSFTNDSLVFLVDTIMNNGLRNAFIIKYDSIGNVLWARSLGGNDIDHVQDLSIDYSGNIYCLGDYSSDSVIVGTDTLINNGEQDFFIINYTSDGSTLWVKNEGGDGLDFSQSIVVDNSNNLFVVGGYESSEIIFGSDTLTNKGNTDVFIVKYNDTGEHIWAKTIGGSDIDFAEHVFADNFGFVYVSGIFKSDSLYIGSQLLLNEGEYDIFISKLDTDGNILWVRAFGGNNYDRIFDAATDNLGNIYITGNYKSDTLGFDNYILINKGEEDIYYAKLDHSGNVTWTKTIGNDNFDFRSRIELFNTTEIYLSGNFRSQSLMIDSLILIRNSYQTRFIAKLDINGNVIWAKTIGDGCYHNYLEDLAIDKAGDIYLTGEFSGEYISFGRDTILNTDITGFYSDIYTLKLIDFPSPPIPQITQFDDTLISDTAHKYQWYYEDNYIWQSIQQKYIAPETGNYFVEITDTNGCSAFSEELYVVVTRIVENSSRDCNTYVFPNPFNNFTLLKIDPVHEEPYSLNIISIDGKVVRNYAKVFSSEILIKKENLQPGLYYYRLRNKHGTIQIGKILIQK